MHSCPNRDLLYYKVFQRVICAEEKLMSGTLPINRTFVGDYVLITPVMANEWHLCYLSYLWKSEQPAEEKKGSVTLWASGSAREPSLTAHCIQYSGENLDMPVCAIVFSNQITVEQIMRPILPLQNMHFVGVLSRRQTHFFPYLKLCMYAGLLQECSPPGNGSGKSPSHWSSAGCTVQAGCTHQYPRRFWCHCSAENPQGRCTVPRKAPGCSRGCSRRCCRSSSPDLRMDEDGGHYFIAVKIR